MSAYVKMSIPVRDRSLLLAALARLGWGTAKVEVHDSPVHLRGYRGDTRAQQAHVVIRARNVWSAANDIGFEQLPDGTWVSHVSTFDRNKAAEQPSRFRGGFDAAFAQAYNVEAAKAALPVDGWTYEESTDKTTGEVLLVAERWS